MDTATIQTGADQAADAVAAKLKAAGWEVRTLRGSAGEPKRFSDGRLIIPVRYSVSLHADGPRSIGCTYLSAYWSTITEATDWSDPASTTGLACPAEVYVGGVKHELATEAEMNTWLDALIAVAAALAA